MVPTSYHQFFSACASVAGALIGLLFVAISVSPHRPAQGQSSAKFDILAGVAFTTLISALVVSLAALIPGASLGYWAAAVSATAVSSVAGLAVITIRQQKARESVRQLARLSLVLVLFVLQLIDSIELIEHPHESGLIGWEAALIISFFIVAIDRAWELVGARDSGLLGVLGGLARERAKDPPPEKPGGTAPG